MTSITTNVAANAVAYYVNQNTISQNTYLSQLSSGSRVVNAATDPAATAIGTKLQSDANVLAQAATNATNMQSVLQTADGALSQIANILTQLKSLASEALSGTQDTDALTDLDKEFSQLISEIDNITTATTFNGTALIDGTFSASVLVGTTSSNTISVDLSSVSVMSSALGISSDGLTTTSAATSALSDIASALNDVAQYRAIVGAYTAQFQYSESVVQIAQQNITAAKSALTDSDTSATETAFNNAQVLTEAGIAALTKAQQIPQDLLRLLQS
jgi:flagellin